LRRYPTAPASRAATMRSLSENDVSTTTWLVLPDATMRLVADTPSMSGI
jgi:hypothetical protein